MEKDLKHIDLIDKYLSGNLKGSEAIAFQELFKTNSDFKKDAALPVAMGKTSAPLSVKSLISGTHRLAWPMPQSSGQTNIRFGMLMLLSNLFC